MRSVTITSFNSRGVEMTARHEDKPLLIKTLLSTSNIALMQETHSKHQHSKTLRSILPSSDLFIVPGNGAAGGLCSAFPSGSTALVHNQSCCYLSVYINDVQPLGFSAYFVSVYLSPNKAADQLLQLLQYIESIPASEHVVLMGDFNLDPKGSTSRLFTRMIGRLREAGMRHIPTIQPTRYGRAETNPSYIDHIFVRLPSTSVTSVSLRPVHHSDHVAVSLLISSRPPSRKSVLASTYADTVFAEFVESEHELRPLSSNYETLVPQLKRLSEVQQY
eukprot:TRINITY_DN977_c0_g2_i2.p1 TRINITY_DN977_c0_g2~~TRINITY_DN977_c0_g2_i2.p1  ORF type:complete len:276 (+),score=20.67 TRINITY_DN977_c0_g2_i2:1537-2364(+)